MNGKRWGPQLSPDKRRGKSKVIHWALVMLWSLPKTGYWLGLHSPKNCFWAWKKMETNLSKVEYGKAGKSSETKWEGFRRETLKKLIAENRGNADRSKAGCQTGCMDILCLDIKGPWILGRQNLESIARDYDQTAGNYKQLTWAIWAENELKFCCLFSRAEL